MTVVSIFPHQIHSMAVFIPERSLVGEGTVGDGNVMVLVISGEGSVLVIRQGIALRETQKHNITLQAKYYKTFAIIGYEIIEIT